MGFRDSRKNDRQGHGQGVYLESAYLEIDDPYSEETVILLSSQNLLPGKRGGL